ncbi:hypothetical protein ACFFU9_13275 [Mariniflexile ostreae]|uniref:Uncharacterized protein n=1 Tax=Mariniflexile ostreae TaxID=1520892 RepID=A0ABV5FF48_9FLAO
MKNKVIHLFNDQNTNPKGEVDYSKLIGTFLAHFKKDFPEDLHIEDISEFTINAWNLANMSLILSSEEFDNILSSDSDVGQDTILLKKMITHKLSNFKAYDHFIVDYQITEGNDNLSIDVVTQTKELYIDALQNSFENDLSESDFTENYIDRNAIVLKAKQPFFNWLNGLYPNEAQHSYLDFSTNVYLVGDEEDDLEKWLKKKFDKLFIKELNQWHTNKKDWPQKRTFKMFKEWFEVNLSDMVYDLQDVPVRKL